MSKIKSPAAAQFATRTPEQVAALDAMRAAKATAAAAPVAATQPDVAIDQVVNNVPVEQRVSRLMEAMNLAFGAPTDDGTVDISFKRTCCAYFAAIAVSVPVSYGISSIAGYAMVASYTLTGSLFFMMLVWLCALMLAIYASIKVAGAVMLYVASSQIDRDVVRAKSAVISFFGTSKSSVAGLFSRKPTVEVTA